MAVGSDRDRADDVELPDHERDEYRQDPADRDRTSDAAEEAGLAAHEDDSTRLGETGTSTTNP